MKRIAIGLLMCSMVAMGGQAFSLEQSQVNNTKYSAKINTVSSSKYNKKVGNVNFQTDVIVQKNHEDKPILNTTATLQELNRNKALDIFFNGIKVKGKIEYENKNEKGQSSKDIRYLADCKDGETWLSVGPGLSGFCFQRTSLSNHILHSFHLEDRDERYNAHKYSLKREFEFATREQAFNDIKDKLSQMGINIENEYKAYALDYETMKKEEYAMGIDGNEDRSVYKDSWTKDDNCYYFVINQRYDNLPVYHLYGDMSTRKEDSTSPIKVLYTKDGIDRIDIEKMFTFNNEGKEVDILPFDKITDNIVAQLKKEEVYREKEVLYRVKKSELNYMVDKASDLGSCKVKPVWIVDIDLCNKNGELEGIQQMVIDAEKGTQVDYTLQMLYKE